MRFYGFLTNKEKGFETPFFTEAPGRPLPVKGVTNPFSIVAFASLGFHKS
jgi:hypothetical protein